MNASARMTGPANQVPPQGETARPAKTSASPGAEMLLPSACLLKQPGMVEHTPAKAKRAESRPFVPTLARLSRDGARWRNLLTASSLLAALRRAVRQNGVRAMATILQPFLSGAGHKTPIASPAEISKMGCCERSRRADHSSSRGVWQLNTPTIYSKSNARRHFRERAGHFSDCEV
jgi:hypothetical protein